jgi:hypothetical protein
MKQLSTAGARYVAFCLATCGYFCIAALGGWPNPFVDNNPGAGLNPSGTAGHSYSSGSYYGRSSGGFGGGGK